MCVAEIVQFSLELVFFLSVQDTASMTIYPCDEKKSDVF